MCFVVGTAALAGTLFNLVIDRCFPHLDVHRGVLMSMIRGWHLTMVRGWHFEITVGRLRPQDVYSVENNRDNSNNDRHDSNPGWYFALLRTHDINLSVSFINCAGCSDVFTASFGV